MVILPSWLLTVSFSNSITLGSVFILAMGIAFAGYFGYRDKSWKIASTGWKEAFEFQQQENKKLAARLIELQHALELCNERPDFSQVIQLVNDLSRDAEKRQNQIIELIGRRKTDSLDTN